MFWLWHDEFKRNDNLEKNAKMKFYMYVIPGYLMINMNVGICNTSHGGRGQLHCRRVSNLS